MVIYNSHNINITMNIIYDLQKALGNLQDNTIGLFKPFKGNTTLMVIENDKGTLKCVSFGNLGGLHTLHIGADQGSVYMFDTGKSLSDIMQDPFNFDRIIKSL